MTSATRRNVLFATSAIAALGYVLVSEGVRRQKTSKADRELRRKARSNRKLDSPETHAFGHASGPLGKWYGHLPAALGTAWKLRSRGRGAAAAAVVGTSLAAIALSRVLDRLMKHRKPPPGRGETGKQSYPSGHALETTSVSIVSGYALVREGFASPVLTLPLSAVSLASGLGRFALDRHWPSDLVGGYCAGIALGTACAGLYEWTRGV